MFFSGSLEKASQPSSVTASPSLGGTERGETGVLASAGALAPSSSGRQGPKNTRKKIGLPIGACGAGKVFSFAKAFFASRVARGGLAGRCQRVFLPSVPSPRGWAPGWAAAREQRSAGSPGLFGLPRLSRAEYHTNVKGPASSPVTQTQCCGHWQHRDFLSLNHKD